MSDNISLVNELKSTLPDIHVPSPPWHIRYGIVPGRPFYIVRDSQPQDKFSMILVEALDDSLHDMVTSLGRAVARLMLDHPTLKRYDYTPDMIDGIARISTGAFTKPHKDHFTTKLSVCVYLIVPIPDPVIH